MRRLGVQLVTALLCLVDPSAAVAQAAPPESLTPQQRTLFLEVTMGELCPCGLPMSLARCLEREDVCERARSAARVVADEVRLGRSYPQVVDVMVRFLEEKVARPTFDLAGRPRLGPESAKAVLVLFSDFQCPYCSRLKPVLDELLEAFPGELALVFKHFPLKFHEHAAEAAAASEVANRRGRFWAFHDAAFSSQGDLSKPRLPELLRGVGVDPAAVPEADWQGARARVDEDKREGTSAGVSATPTLVLIGLELPVEDYKVGVLKARVRAALEAARGKTTGGP